MAGPAYKGMCLDTKNWRRGNKLELVLKAAPVGDKIYMYEASG